MGRPPSNGGPTFRFVQSEVTEMEAILQQYNNTMPSREVLMAVADKFSESPERKGKITVQMKQVWNWFQNRRYAIRAKSSKVLGKLDMSPMSRDDSAAARNVPQGPQQIAAPVHVPSVPGSGKGASENAIFEFEAKSGRDGAWYDVANFLSHKNLETVNPEVLVRFAGFGPEEDEWVNVRKHVRQRSLPCESSECVAVLPGDLILCFQEGKEQALYFDAHVLDAQRRRHDVRGCRCRFLVRYVHDQSEEIVPLRKVCRRPETDYRLQQLHAVNEAISAEQKSMEQYMASATSGEMMQKQQNAVPPTFYVTASLPTQTTTPELRRSEISTVVRSGNSSAPLSSSTVITSAPATVVAPGGSVSTVPKGN
ncbi:protein SAWADEE HOMEODOMAIN HOMOLOG 2-like isoform X3 [Malus sylvestris]|nr:protein SAWADEE HOMEODOMAIN HOMOLOG 2-like isoform X4 [Malus domestica]XP_050139508.1 protein SAWADEE HOMEODOMAIN HOMOLOG 2-like isoform X3 [Malus sylvestris]